MEQYILKVNPVNAVQWFKEGDHPAVKYHPYCGYRACPICDGEDKNYHYVKNSDRVLYVDPGDWIAEDSEGIIYVYSDEYFGSTYAPSPANAAPQPPHVRKEDIEAEWEKLWKDIVTNPDGSINIEQLKKELYDFSYVMEQVPKVYCHITGDRLSKIMYPAETVIRVADDYANEIVEREMADRQEGLRWVQGEYERLYQQVKSGKRSVCYIDYQFSGEIIARDICTIKPRIDGDELDLSIRGLSYGSTWDPAYQGSTQCDKFVNMCTHFNVEWLDESATTKEGEIAFAEWAAKGLWSTHDGMWYEYQNQDNPITGEKLYDLYQQSLTNKTL